MTPLAFKPQPVYLRPHHFETPHSYLDRLCAVNMIDRPLVNSLIRKRRNETGRSHHLALAIDELGGPHATHFVRSYLRATRTPQGDADTLLTETYRKRSTGIRYACTYCTAGHSVPTFDHHQFSICLKHGRWLAPDHGHEYQRQVPGHGEWVRAERRYRRAISTGLLARHLVDATWRIVRDQATVLGPPSWTGHLRAAEARPGFIDGVDDQLALYPQTAQVLHLLSGPRTWEAIDALFRSPEHLRAYLRGELAWVTGAQWVLIEALTIEVIRSRSARLQQLGMLLRPHLDEKLRRHFSSATT
ncbi:hypothetical protein [Rhodococcus sp. H29-C3]|uniref:hypothetical protein n=1 Tax=Rhodococcus sp. H29-C3 TaxID=3046307 RepID=UPI0024BA46CE|nr:hypothetical protein [Rhodococcus sp. H29-C3]MDJ0362285.1 hypothetical protein [Rhodococcus sp. H29-C3]